MGDKCTCEVCTCKLSDIEIQALYRKELYDLIEGLERATYKRMMEVPNGKGNWKDTKGGDTEKDT